MNVRGLRHTSFVGFFLLLGFFFGNAAGFGQGTTSRATGTALDPGGNAVVTLTKVE